MISGFTQTPNNDECANSETITISTAGVTTVNTNTTTATQSTIASCESLSETWLDTWYTFSMPVNGNIHITNASILDYFTLYDTCNGTEIDCTNNNNSLFYNLTMGTNYILRYSNRDSQANSNSFDIQAFETAPNDDCANASNISLTIGSATTVNTETRGATQSTIASCESVSDTWLDTWYTFSMPVNGNIHITNASFSDYFTLYDTCNGTEIDCTNNNNSLFYNLTMGTTYILRYSNRDYQANSNSFDIQVFETAPNDDCANASNISLTIGSATTVNTETRGATQSTIASCESASYTWLDTWYTFSMPVNGNIHITNASIFDSFTLYDTCNGNEIACNSGNNFFYNLTMGTTYILRYSNRDYQARSYSFDIQAFETAPNDDCANALPIQVAPIGQCTAENVIVNFPSATAGTLSSCLNSSDTNLDLWYTFEAPLTGNITLNSNGLFFDKFAVYDSCGGTEITCFSTSGTIPITLGQLYYIQVSKRDIYANQITFCLEGAPDVSPGIAGSCENLPAITISTANGNNNMWSPILDSAGKIVASINANGNDLGTVNSSLFIENNSTRDFMGQPYLRREISISPQNQPTNNVDVRLYLLGTEFNDLAAADSNITSISDLNLMKISGSGCTTGYNSGGIFMNTTGNTYGNEYFQSFSVNSFSTFYPSSRNLENVLSNDDIKNNQLNMLIYPSIVDRIIYFKMGVDTQGISTIKIYDLNGKLVFKTTKTFIGSTPEAIKINKLSSGMYFVKVYNGDKFSVLKILKE